MLAVPSLPMLLVTSDLKPRANQDVNPKRTKKMRPEEVKYAQFVCNILCKVCNLYCEKVKPDFTVMLYHASRTFK